MWTTTHGERILVGRSKRIDAKMRKIAVIPTHSFARRPTPRLLHPQLMDRS